jgi:two-component system nitrogen regulation response regulator NtrX
MNSTPETQRGMAMAVQGSILIVEDDPGCREALIRVLQGDYRICMAADGKEALDILKEVDFDLITLDLHLPKLSGIDILPEIRRMAPHTEIVVISGHGTLDNLGKVIPFGVSHFLSKPFVISEVLAIVQNALAHRKFRSEITEFFKEGKTLRRSLKGGPGSPRAEKGRRRN